MPDLVRLFAVLVLLALLGETARADEAGVVPDLHALFALNQILFDKSNEPICLASLPLAPSAIPERVKNALIAVEDQRFRYHHGIDPYGMARAFTQTLWHLWAHKGGRQGGSTITQQLVKNLLYYVTDAVARKFPEAEWAISVEEQLSKEEIIAAYLNRVGFGYSGGQWMVGAEQASRAYFGKSASELGLYEAAMLAGLVQGPNYLNPLRHPERARKRARTVLGLMKDQGYITEAEMRRALVSQPARGRKRPVKIECRYFADLARAQLARVGIEPSPGLRLFVTLDTEKQYWAERAVASFAAKSGGAVEGALVSLDRTGAVRALVGGRQYGLGHVNRATLAERQPGSAFKHVVYVAALEKGMHPENRVRHGSFTGKTCSYEEREGGVQKITLTQALARSSNSAAVRLADFVGIGTLLDVAKRLGIRSALRANCSLALGASEVTLLDLTASYATLADGGRKVEPVTVIAVAKEGDLTVLKPRRYDRVLTRPVAAAVAGMLRGVVLRGTGRAAAVVKNAAGKTGTSQLNRDAWFIGYAGPLITGVWFGKDDSSPTDGLTGAQAATAWANFYLNSRAGG